MLPSLQADCGTLTGMGWAGSVHYRRWCRQWNGRRGMNGLGVV